ncbi:MAG: APC family permease [Spirochaetes bacterium]|nr:APC family permease [Spirochaetota bacterium]
MKVQKMSLWSAILMGIGCIIGASIFATTPIAIKIVGGNGIVWGFVFAAVFVFLRTMPEMALTSALPATGASYVHVSRLVHPYVGIWVSINDLVIGPMKIATMALTFATYFNMLVPAWSPVLVAVAITVIFATITLYGMKIASWVQNVCVAVLLVALGLYVIMGWGHTVVTLGEVLSTTFQLSKMWAAMGIMHGSLIGANALMYMADEIEDPGRTIPVAFIVGTIFTAILYAAMAFVTIGVMPDFYKIDNLATVAKVFMSPAMLVFFIAGGALLAVVTSINAAILMFSRSHLAGARDGLYPELIAKINSHGAPAYAICLTSGIAILAMISKYNLTDVINITAIPGLLLSPIIFSAVFFLPRRFPASYKTSWLHIPHWINCVIVVAATALCWLLGIYVLKQMAPKNYITMVIFYTVALVYVLFRVNFLKRKGIDMIATLKIPPESWVVREKAALEELAARKA